MMTVERFQEEKARLVALYGQGSHAATGKRVQALAKLYAESGWTERALAEIEGMSKSRINQQLIFGRFLLFLPTNGGQDYPYPRAHVSCGVGHTDPTQSDTARFQAMLDTMATEQHMPAARPGTPQLPKQILAQLPTASGTPWPRLPRRWVAISPRYARSSTASWPSAVSRPLRKNGRPPKGCVPIGW